MIRKMLLVGCRVGAWVPVHGMGELEVRVQPEGAKVRLEHCVGHVRAVAECDETEGLLVEVIG